jgi:8-oxo-dGTP diphosphatase
MVSGDGNGWVECRCGHRHWGRYGAAGLALLRMSPSPQVLLQLRAGWTHEGGRWGVVGGARDSHESLAEAALREAAEEASVEASQVTVLRTRVGVDHGDWAYSYVIGLAAPGLTIGEPTAESDELRWVDLDDVAGLPLHGGFGSTWPVLRELLTQPLTELTDLDSA